jgi:hypothetical protein
MNGSGGVRLRALQARPAAQHNEEAVDKAVDKAVAQAQRLGCSAIAWTLGEDAAAEQAALAATRAAGLAAHAWLQVARDPQAARTHPHWMHAPQHHEWLRRFPAFNGGHPALVAPYIGLNTVAAFEHTLGRTVRLLRGAPWAERVWLADIQGPPMGCGCGNPCCRSWDNAPGTKLASTPYDHPELLFPLEFFAAVAAALPEIDLVPVLCPECERGISLGGGSDDGDAGIQDPDGPEGTDLCQGVACRRPCALDYWPKLLEAFREREPRGPVGLLLLTTALGKDHPVFGPPRSWSRLAYQHYSQHYSGETSQARPPLVACVEPEDADAFSADVLVLTDAPQSVWPASPPPGYVPEVPAIRCGYCPPSPLPPEG